MKLPGRTLILAFGLVFSKGPVFAYSNGVAFGSDTITKPLVLKSSRVKVTVGPLWQDVEEDVELGVDTGYDGRNDHRMGVGPWRIEGAFDVPAGAVVTGCLFWNNDTLLMGKLRGRVNATPKFDSLVSPLPKGYQYDPLQIDQLGATEYSIKFLPVAGNRTRRVRIRYLVPVTSNSGEVSVLPLFSQWRGNITSLAPSWTLEVRGSGAGLDLYHDTTWSSITTPATRTLDFATCGEVKLRWTTLSGDGTRAVRGRMDSGAWQGDYVLFTGKLPDSIGRRLDIRSETVFLWRWIHPELFFFTAGAPGALVRMNNDFATEADGQARKITSLSTQIVGKRQKVGLVVDKGISDSALVVFPLSDSGSPGFKRMKAWLDGIDVNYWRANMPDPPTGGGDSGQADFTKFRHEFRTDLREVGTLYSRDSGVVRHLVIVTVGPVPAGGESQMPDLSELPDSVSVASSRLVLQTSQEYYCGLRGYCGYVTRSSPPLESQWPGVDLSAVAASRNGSGKLDSIESVPLPKYRTHVSATLSLTSDQGVIQTNVAIQRGPDGSWTAGINAQAKGIGQQVKWDFYDDSARSISSWSQAPAWIVANGDSVLPRIWANSPGRLSPNFMNNTSLAPVFGFVDWKYSLLATPSDTLGRQRQRAYADSGVPFLSTKDIFAQVGIGENRISAIRAIAKVRCGMLVRLLAGLRKVDIDFAGLDPVSIEIRDVRGHKVAGWDRQALIGKTSVTWNGRNSSSGSVPGGLYVVVLRTATRTWTASVALP